MSVKILIDMNLSPDWVPVLKRHGWSAVHWSTIGDQRDSDRNGQDAIDGAVALVRHCEENPCEILVNY